MKNVLFTGLIIFSVSLNAGQMSGVEMPETVEIAGQTLKLNGQGLRLATFFKVKVYVAGLYVTETSQDPDILLKNSQTKLLKLSLLRDLKAKQFSEALEEGFQKACVAQECVQYKESIQKLSQLQRDVGKGETLEYVFFSEKFEVRYQNKILGAVESQGFSSVMLRVWLGKEPPNHELKKGLLGLIKKKN